MSDETTEDAWVRACEAEDVAERARWERARAEADLTPAAADGTWRVRARWAPGAPDMGAADETLERAASLGEASRYGRRLCCLRGVVAVTVFGPDGHVHATYDRADGFWLTHTGAARAEITGGEPTP